MESSDFLPPFTPRFVAFARRLPSRARRFAPRHVERAMAGPGLLVVSGCPPDFHDGDDRTSQVPGEPLCVYALLFDPGRASVPGDYGTSVLPPLRKPRRPPQSVSFRGSITRPARSLCTLRSRGRPRTTQHSVPAGGQPLPGQDFHLLGRIEGFCHRFMASPFSKLGLAQAG